MDEKQEPSLWQRFKVWRIPRWLRAIALVACVVIPIWFWMIGQHGATVTFLLFAGLSALGALGDRQKRRH